jgi:hypothetical protein
MRSLTNLLDVGIKDNTTLDGLLGKPNEDLVEIW